MSVYRKFFSDEPASDDSLREGTETRGTWNPSGVTYEPCELDKPMFRKGMGVLIFGDVRL